MTEPAEVTVSRPDASNPGGAGEGETPEAWQWRFDRGSDYLVGSEKDSVDTWFVTMTPGWHVTTRPAGIFFHPGSTASGDYTASTKISLFDPGERNEGYGLMIGGSDLQGSDQAYLYFLLKRSGEFLIKHRQGTVAESIVGWTAHEAIAAWTDDSQGAISNVLSVTVQGANIVFSVNETEVASLPRSELPTDGVVGLRLNHGINVHVSELSVTPIL